MSSNQSDQQNNIPANINNQQQEIKEEQVKVDETLPMAHPVNDNEATYASVPVAQTISRNQEQTIMQYIPPVYTISSPDIQNQNTIVTEPMVIAYQYGKSVKCLTLFDIFFGFLHLLVTPLGIINIIFPLFGYKGASTYNKCFVNTYLIYQILIFFINIFILNIVLNNNFELSEDQTLQGHTVQSLTFFQILNILFNFYFIRITAQLSRSINKITDPQKTFLMHLNFHNTGGMYY